MLLKPPKERSGVIGLFTSFLPEILIVLAIVGAVVGKKVFSDQYVTTVFTQDFFEKEVQITQMRIKAAMDTGQPAPDAKSIRVMLAILQGPIAKKLESKQPIDMSTAKTFLLSFDEGYATKDQIIKAHKQIEVMESTDPNKLITAAEDTYRRLKKAYEENKPFFTTIGPATN